MAAATLSSMGYSHATCCACCSLVFCLGCLILLFVGVAEKNRWDPVYTPVRCTTSILALPLTLVSFPPGLGMPAGSPPYGMYGNISTSLTCENPNEADLTMIREGSVSYLLVPNFSNPNLLPYIEIARSYMTGDVSLPSRAKVTFSSRSEVKLPFSNFGMILNQAASQGYVPIYTRRVGVVRSCASLFGIRSCTKKTAEKWCGVLGASCKTETKAMPGVLVPAVCSITRTICKDAEAEVKSLVVPNNLNVTIAAVLPCPAGSMMPPGAKCSFAAAPGLQPGTGKALPIPDYIDDMDPPRKDLDDAETAVKSVTIGVISTSAVLAVASFAIAAGILWRQFIHRPAAAAAHQTPGVLPTVLASSPNYAQNEVVDKA